MAYGIPSSPNWVNPSVKHMPSCGPWLLVLRSTKRIANGTLVNAK